MELFLQSPKKGTLLTSFFCLSLLPILITVFFSCSADRKYYLLSIAVLLSLFSLSLLLVLHRMFFLPDFPTELLNVHKSSFQRVMGHVLKIPAHKPQFFFFESLLRLLAQKSRRVVFQQKKKVAAIIICVGVGENKKRIVQQVLLLSGRPGDN